MNTNDESTELDRMLGKDVNESGQMMRSCRPKHLQEKESEAQNKLLKQLLLKGDKIIVLRSCATHLLLSLSWAQNR